MKEERAALHFSCGSLCRCGMKIDCNKREMQRSAPLASSEIAWTENGSNETSAPGETS